MLASVLDPSTMKYVIDIGHGGRDPGAVYRGVQEKDIVLPIGLRLRSRLWNNGHDVVLTRVGDTFPGLGERVRIANESGADAFISLHLNADRDADGDGMPEAKGQEIWYWKDEDLELARHLEAGLRRIFPTEPFRGVKKGKLYVVRKTTMPAALVELGFIDRSITARRVVQPLEQEEIALALELGLLRRQQLQEQGTVFE